MFHELLQVWFGWVDTWGYAGVFVLMAMESSIIPVPSEIVMPPAAFWAAQGRMSFAGVVLAGTLGSYFGSILNYWAAQWVGESLITRYGKYLGITQKKYQMAQKWVSSFGVMGVFVARLLPVVRHLISIPAGVLKIPFTRFSIATITGAGLWCFLLSWFGLKIIGQHPELLQSPEAMIHVIKDNMLWWVGGVVGFVCLYCGVIYLKKRVLLLQHHNVT